MGKSEAGIQGGGCARLAESDPLRSGQARSGHDDDSRSWAFGLVGGPFALPRPFLAFSLPSPSSGRRVRTAVQGPRLLVSGGQDGA